MRFTKLTYIAHELTAALGSGRFHDITDDEVWEHIDDGTIFEFLRERLDFMVSLSVLGPVDRIELLIEWEQMRGCEEPFRFNGHHNGLPVLVAYLLQGVRLRADNPRYRLVLEHFNAALRYEDERFMDN